MTVPTGTSWTIIQALEWIQGTQTSRGKNDDRESGHEDDPLANAARLLLSALREGWLIARVGLEPVHPEWFKQARLYLEEKDGVDHPFFSAPTLWLDGLPRSGYYNPGPGLPAISPVMDAAVVQSVFPGPLANLPSSSPLPASEAGMKNKGGAPTRYDAIEFAIEACALLYEGAQPKNPSELRSLAIEAYQAKRKASDGPSVEWAKPIVRQVWARFNPTS